jgi:hypothetical protein
MPPTYKHPKFTMKRTWKAVGVFAAVMFLLMVTGAGGALVDTVVFYARVAKLYTEEPHSKIKMPVDDVAKREVTDTWARRGVAVERMKVRTYSRRREQRYFPRRMVTFTRSARTISAGRQCQ